MSRRPSVPEFSGALFGKGDIVSPYYRTFPQEQVYLRGGSGRARLRAIGAGGSETFCGGARHLSFMQAIHQSR